MEFPEGDVVNELTVNYHRPKSNFVFDTADFWDLYLGVPPKTSQDVSQSDPCTASSMDGVYRSTTPCQEPWQHSSPQSTALPASAVKGMKKRKQSSVSVASKKKKVTLQKDELQDPSRPKKPKRALTAYNLFFKHERQRILAALPERARGKPRNSHGKLGFEEMGRLIGSRWQSIDATTKAYFQRLAEEEKIKKKKDTQDFSIEIEKWKEDPKTIPISDASSEKTKGDNAATIVHDPRTYHAWSMAELAHRLGDDSVDILIRIFL